MNEFYIFGLQRSGTTFLEQLLHLNFGCRVANSHDSWKHSIEKLVFPSYTIFNIYKNPYTWIESVMFREHADLPITSPQILEESSLNDGLHLRINPVELAKIYENYCNNWCVNLSNNTFIIRYEDLIEKDSLKHFIEMIPFTRICNDIKIPKAGFWMSEGFKEDIIPYYLKGIPEHLNSHQINAINEIISDQTFSRLGYQRINL
jgi:hypothetical protein